MPLDARGVPIFGTPFTPGTRDADGPVDPGPEHALPETLEQWEILLDEPREYGPGSGSGQIRMLPPAY